MLYSVDRIGIRFPLGVQGDRFRHLVAGKDPFIDQAFFLEPAAKGVALFFRIYRLIDGRFVADADNITY